MLLLANSELVVRRLAGTAVLLLAIDKGAAPVTDSVPAAPLALHVLSGAAIACGACCTMRPSRAAMLPCGLPGTIGAVTAC